MKSLLVVFFAGFSACAGASSAKAVRDTVVSGSDGAAIQRAIDAAAAAGGGRVIVPAGEYPSGSLRLRTHVELHLEKGATIRGGTRSEDYFSFPEGVCSIRPEGSSRVFLYAWDEDDVAITGAGVIDGQGPAFFDPTTRKPGALFWSKPACERPRMVQLVNCRNVRLQGVTFKDSPGWTMLIRCCQDVEVEAIRVEAEQRMINSDGIDFDGCRHVRVRDSDFRTGDDCLIMRAMREAGSDARIVCEDVLVENCRLDSACQCIRMGCPSDDTIRNVIFRGIRMSGRNGIYFNNPARYLRPTDEGYLDVSDIRFEGFTGGVTGSAIQIDVEAGIRLRGVRDILFRDFDVRSDKPLRFVGNIHTKFARVRFENVTVNGIRQADGEVAGDFSEAGPLVRVRQSWEAAKAKNDPCPWVTDEEREFFRKRTYGLETNPGTPESDAARFYTNPEKTEWVDFNYDEAKAGELGKDYTLEDPLRFADGRKVATAADWPARRKEILKLFESEVYGKLPPKPDVMVFDVTSEKMSEDRFATMRVYRQYFRKDKTGPVIDWFVAVPRHAKGKVPVFLHLNYHGIEKIAAGRTNHYHLPWDQLIANGFAFMSAKYTQITSDGKERPGESGGLFNGVCELWGKRDPKATDNPGTLIVWAWGLMRGLDLAGEIPEIDATRNVVIGSSRLGKAALLAAAYDERFTVCIPNQTGACGVQLMKRDYGETAKGQRYSLPHWYCRAYWKYMDDPRSQPFDQHLLLACVAPRALLLECYHKKWFDPKGEFLAAKAASPVWEFLTGKGLGLDEWPEPYSDVAVRPPFGYVRRTECHGLSPYDWKWAIDFARKALSD